MVKRVRPRYAITISKARRLRPSKARPTNNAVVGRRYTSVRTRALSNGPSYGTDRSRSGLSRDDEGNSTRHSRRAGSHN
jgi:hypothetical protein